MCAQGEEDVMHLTHGCQFARQCHFGGPLALRAEELQGDFKHVFLSVSSQLEDPEWMLYVNSLWGIWRCRNDRVYGGKLSGFVDFTCYLTRAAWESTLGATRIHAPKRGNQVQITELQEESEFSCYLDGSWKEDGERGVGIALFKEEELLVYRSESVQACCPFQVEALAFRVAIKLVLERGMSNCSLYSDNLTLVNACNSLYPPLDVDWRAHEEVMEVWKLLKLNRELHCVHVQRNSNELANELARMGRVKKWCYKGYTFPMFQFQV